MQSLGRASRALPAKTHCSLVFKTGHSACNNCLKSRALCSCQNPGAYSCLCHRGPQDLAVSTKGSV